MSKENIVTLNFIPSLNLTPSSEQLVIINNLLNHKHVIVQAVAGAGKTTLALILATLSKKRILHLTYNKELQEDNKKKIDEAGLSDYIKSYTIHGLANMIALQNRLNGVYDDVSLKHFLEHNWTINNFNFDYVIIDEVQDADTYMMLFFKRLYETLNQQPTVLVVGDQKQMLYGLKGASSSHLLYFDQFLNLPMVHLGLKTSFRLPINTCNILNEAFLKKDLLVGTKNTGGMYIYAFKQQPRENSYTYKQETNKKINQLVLSYIKQKITTEQANYDDFFILGFSIKSNDFKSLENYLTNHDLPVYYPLEEANASNTKGSKSEIKNKIVFCSINQAKGRERKYVILPFFDVTSYNKWLQNEITAKTFKQDIPNLHYVALTRATRETIVLLNNSLVPNYITQQNPSLKKTNNLMPYINYQTLLTSKNVTVFNREALIMPKNMYQFTPTLFKQHEIYSEQTINTLTSYLPRTVLDPLSKLIKQKANFHMLNDYKLNLKQDLSINDTSYRSIVNLLNSFYLFQNYLSQYYVSNFQANWTYLLKLINNQLTYLNFNTTCLTYFKNHQAEINKDFTSWWNHTPVPYKLMVCCLALAIKTKIYSIAQLPAFTWLDDFKQLDVANQLFNQFNLNTGNSEISFYYEISHLVKEQFNETITCFIDHKAVTLTNIITLDPNIFHPNWHIKLKTRISLLTNNQLFNFNASDKISDESLIKTSLDLYVLYRFKWSIQTSLNDAKSYFLTKAKPEQIAQADTYTNIFSKQNNLKELLKFAMAYNSHNSTFLSAKNWHELMDLRQTLNTDWLNFLDVNPWLTSTNLTGFVLNYFSGSWYEIKDQDVNDITILSTLLKNKLKNDDLDAPLSIKLNEFETLNEEINTHLKNSTAIALDDLLQLDLSKDANTLLQTPIFKEEVDYSWLSNKDDDYDHNLDKINYNDDNENAI